MRFVEEAHPRPGLSVPVVSVLDQAGGLVEEDQRALVALPDRCTGHKSMYPYDTADTAADLQVLQVRMRQIRAMSYLDFVRGIELSELHHVSSSEVLG